MSSWSSRVNGALQRFCIHILGTIHRPITSKLVTEMAECGVTQVAPSTKKHLRHKGESKSGESLHITPNDKGKLLVPWQFDNGWTCKGLPETKYELNEHKSSISEHISQWNWRSEVIWLFWSLWPASVHRPASFPTVLFCQLMKVHRNVQAENLQQSVTKSYFMKQEVRGHKRRGGRCHI